MVEGSRKMRTFKELIEAVRLRELGENELKGVLQEIAEGDLGVDKTYYLVYDILSLQPVTPEQIDYIRTKITRKVVDMTEDTIKESLDCNMYLNREELVRKIIENDFKVYNGYVYLIGTYESRRMVEEGNDYETYGDIHFQNYPLNNQFGSRLKVPLSEVVYTFVRPRTLTLTVRDCSVIKTWWREHEE